MSATIFGIRHHGPGSAQSLIKAFEQFQPDCILIEAPADAQSAINDADLEGLIPPVAIVVYNPNNLTQAIYLPFAEFSPEWQAIQFGLKNKILVEAIDLPMERSFSFDEKTLTERQLDFDFNPSTDPLGYIAQLAGYSDSERWWEVAFEQAENETIIFDAILDMMTTLRNELQRPETMHTLLREAYMRNAIRKAKENFERIAVVCGAWHAPVLHHLDDFKKNEDRNILRSIGKIKTAVTWAPWSYERLAFRSGYGAGVISPAWYELLFQNRVEATTVWFSKAALLLRKEGIDASSAEVIEAIRLANTLATMRERTIPGQDELQEVAVTVLGRGDEIIMELIENKLIIGDIVGEVPSDIAPPLQQDLEKSIKSARLTKAYQTSETISKSLDLRNETHLYASYLLHRLRILGIPWGRLQEASQYQKGSFKESWELKWELEFILRLIEAGMWGNTIAEATKNFVIHKASETDQLSELTALTGEVLLADLPEVVEPLLSRLRDAVAVSTDVFYLMEALEPLVRIIRYGNIRKTDGEIVRQLVDELIPRICIGLSNACRDIDEDLAKAFFKSIIITNQTLALLADETHNAQWSLTLEKMIQETGINELLRGACTRLLFDKGRLDVIATEKLLHYALSSHESVVQAVSWLEGFLHGSGLLLIHNQSLWRVLDDWLSDLDSDHFEQILPLLRRAFAQFTVREREKMLQLAIQPPKAVDLELEESFDHERAEKVHPTISLLLGLHD
ncbi:MAG: DUF5682 family protein [Saprospiraceae bacterium]|nr:DUF5682 family protein [Saprospiraceae bacterium]